MNKVAKYDYSTKLKEENKFFLYDDDDNLILIEEIDVDPMMVVNGYMELKGSRFFVDYKDNIIEKAKHKVRVQISFDIEDIQEVD